MRRPVARGSFVVGAGRPPHASCRHRTAACARAAADSAAPAEPHRAARGSCARPVSAGRCWRTAAPAGAPGPSARRRTRVIVAMDSSASKAGLPASGSVNSIWMEAFASRAGRSARARQRPACDGLTCAGTVIQTCQDPGACLMQDAPCGLGGACCDGLTCQFVGGALSAANPLRPAPPPASRAS